MNNIFPLRLRPIMLNIYSFYRVPPTNGAKRRLWVLEIGTITHKLCSPLGSLRLWAAPGLKELAINRIGLKLLLIPLFALTSVIFTGCPDSVSAAKSKIFVNTPVEYNGMNLNYSYESDTTITIEVSGPADLIDTVTVDDLSVRINVEGVGPGTYDGTPVICDIPDGLSIVEIDPPELTMVVTLLSVERKFEDIAVELTGSKVDYIYETYPTICDVLILGPREVIDSLNTDLVMAYIDVADLEEGTYVLDIKVTVIPDTISVIGTTPGTVLLNITPLNYNSEA